MAGEGWAWPSGRHGLLNKEQKKYLETDQGSVEASYCRASLSCGAMSGNGLSGI